MAHYHGDFKPHNFDWKAQPELLKYRIGISGGSGPTRTSATFAAVVGVVAVAGVMTFFTQRVFNPEVKTLTKEWKAAEAKLYEKENVYAVRNHKIGGPALATKQDTSSN